jgi:hypothetical protein
MIYIIYIYIIYIYIYQHIHQYIYNVIYCKGLSDNKSHAQDHVPASFRMPQFAEEAHTKLGYKNGILASNNLGKL